MPTGYTADILDGKITTAKEFAQLCARAFMWNMRDEPFRAQLTMPRPDTKYYEEKLAEALDKLTSWDNATEEERYAEWSDYVDNLEARARESRETAQENLQRLVKILDEVKAIEPPETHVNFHKFMIEQIEGTIQYDGTYRENYYKSEPYDVWVDRRRGDIVKDIDYYARQIAKAEERYQEGLAWVQTLCRVYGVKVTYE